MLVAQLINRFRHGGGENVALNYAKVLTSLGVEVTIFGKRESREYLQQVCRYSNVCFNFFEILKLRYDSYIIHSNLNLLRMLFVKVIRPYSVGRKKIIYIQHLNYSKRKFYLLSKLINFVCTDFIQITPITKNVVDKNIKVRKHFIVNFYVSQYSEIECNSIRDKVRTELNLSVDETVFLFSAVFKKGKGLKDFLDLASFYSCDINKKFILIGDGEEAPLINGYHNLSNLKWIGFVNDVERYLIASDVYVFTSLFKFEMLPVALIEAMNSRKKILAYNTEINKFLLGGQTVQNFNELICAIDKEFYATEYPSYGMQYGIDKLSLLLNI